MSTGRGRRFLQFSNQYLDFASETQYRVVRAHGQDLERPACSGDPTKASVEKGERIWELMTDHLVRFVETLKTLSLEEIYERRH